MILIKDDVNHVLCFTEQFNKILENLMINIQFRLTMMAMIYYDGYNEQDYWMRLQVC